MQAQIDTPDGKCLYRPVDSAMVRSELLAAISKSLFSEFRLAEKNWVGVRNEKSALEPKTCSDRNISRL